MTNRLLIEDTGPVRVITLNRPEVHNAFDDKLIAELHLAFTDADRNDDVRVVVLAANGKSFSAGADLNYMRRIGEFSREDNVADANRMAKMLHALYSLRKPTIARVSGSAFGGGVGLVSCCDFAIAAHDASFAFSEARIGIIPATISPFVVDAIGQKQASRLFMRARPFSAERALQVGLISEVCKSDELDQRIGRLTQDLLHNGPEAVVRCKQLARRVGMRAIDDTLLQETAEAIAERRESDEGREGLDAFLNQRMPD